MNKAVHPYLFLALFFLLSGGTTTPILATGPVDDAIWESVTKEVDYGPGPESTEQAEEEEEEKGETRNRERESFWASFFKVLFIIGLVGTIAYVFSNMVEGERSARKKDTNGQSLKVTVDLLEKDLDNASLNPIIKEADQTANFSLAIRLRYLQIIQGLSKKSLIRWKREKTNGQYLQEIKDPTLKTQFAKATYIFEQIWYGNRPIDPGLFQELCHQLEAINTSVTQFVVHE